MSDPLAKHAFRPGDEVRILGIPPSPPMRIIDCTDPALLVLEAPSGYTVRVGRLSCELVTTGEGGS